MTLTEKHSKHTDLVRPRYGEFSRLEFGMVGAPCGLIQDIADQVMRNLAPDHHVAYVDADHAAGDRKPEQDVAWLRYTDKISGRRLDMRCDPNKYERQKLFNSADLVLVNGNHFHTNRQVVIIHPQKRESLQRKLDRLDNIALVLLAEGATDVYDFVSALLPQNVSIMRTNDTDAITDWFRDAIADSIPAINGLVLAGGKSLRMGFDKTSIEYYGKPHSEHLADELSERCDSVFVSRREDQSGEAINGYKVLQDTFTGLGPFGGILSAFRCDPNSAWLVVASDLPFANMETFDALLEHRNPSRIATAFMNDTTGFPDPLITLWEPRAYPVMLEFLGLGYSCPRKVLINSDVEIVAGKQQWLTNVNTAADLNMVKSKLS